MSTETPPNATQALVYIDKASTAGSAPFLIDDVQLLQAEGAPGATGPTGPTGEPGADGADGEPGATGPTGPTGEPGADGADGAPGATGSTGPTGEPGADGADGAPGATGPTGPTGEPGADGADGAAGATGPTGPTGEPGADGADGAPGATGPTGPTGEPGADGADGAPGATGPTGPTGEPGADGADGAPGATGPTGPTGEPGADGADGAPGATGPTGPTGEPGADGADGAPGATGPTGPTGEPGADGADGAPGATGPTGPTGEPGADGADGAPGATGPTGPTGETGATGTTGETGTFGPPFDVYVSAGAVGGDGTITNPYGTIQEGVTAVAVNGTVHILAGTYNLTAQIVVNKQGVTIKGHPGNLLFLQAPLIPLMVVGNNITIEGLTMTSDIAYVAEFIQIGGSNNRVQGNVIFGPDQAPLPMADWVVNRAIVSQINSDNLLVRDNIFYSMRSGMYINPGTTGHMVGNVIYYTKGGFLVDGASVVISENSWGMPVNEVDISLFANVPTGAPYDPLSNLSTYNNGAFIEDNRP
ncbi:collagen-like triple helix repeat-containing protein [Paenibacillus sp. IB182363]|uniref:Collagen-like triple helix repeat-containing protein n=1 Tax=Paenibacillus oceani TaxID=2772510 RepID=A0A927GXR5_9BACL|nr:collagen-like triple helix repeat-containing protein [Paenibacillus oceani]